MAGIQERLLRIDLKQSDISEERLPRKWYSQYLGGLGLGLRYLLEDIQSTRSLDEPLLIMAGPFAGTPIPGSAPAVVISVTKKGLHYDMVYGNVAAAIRLAGFDGVVLNGKSLAPVWVAIASQGIALKAIPNLEPENALDTEAKIRDLTPEALTVLAVGTGKNTDIKSNKVNMNGELLSKGVKAISIVADGQFDSERNVKDLLWDVNLYLFNSIKEQGETVAQTAIQVRKSCFGCPRGCVDVHRDGQEANFALTPSFNSNQSSVEDLLSEENNRSLKYCLPSCPKWTLPQKKILEWLEAITGFAINADELEIIGARVFTLYKILDMYYAIKSISPAQPEYLRQRGFNEQGALIIDKLEQLSLPASITNLFNTK